MSKKRIREGCFEKKARALAMEVAETFMSMAEGLDQDQFNDMRAAAIEKLNSLSPDTREEEWTASISW